MSEETKVYKVESVDGVIVKLVAESDGHEVELLADMLPEDVQEGLSAGARLEVPVGGGGAADWEGAGLG